MGDDSSNVLELLQTAIRIELRGKRFYQEAAEQTTDPLGKKGFESLIAEEEVHCRILKAEHDALSGGKGWVDLDAAKESPFRVFPSDEESIEDWISPGTDDVEALELAMEFERKGFEMYDRAAKEAQDPAAKYIFRHLADAENKHYAFLQTTHDYLTTKGSWYYDEQEFPFFEG